MELEQLTTLISSAIGTILAIISLIVNKNPKKVKTPEEIKAIADAKAQKYFEKQCKKNKIEVVKSVENNKVIKIPDTINL